MIVRRILVLVLITGVSLTYSFSQDLKLTCGIANDTVSISKPFFIKVLLQNTSKKKIKLPQGFHVKSNYLPNGLDFPLEGIELYFNIFPTAPEAEVFIEGLSVIKPSQFYVVRPGNEKEFTVDIGKHLEYIREFLEKENPEIPLNVVYSITCRASNSLYFLEETKDSTMFMDIQSQPLTFYLSP